MQQMLSYMLENNLITRQQFGFLSKCSTCTQLFDSVNDWTLVVRDRRSVDVIYFDFANAFDSVSHPKLVHKLEAYGICGNLPNILTDFLLDRSHRVVLSNADSTFLPVGLNSGVPQGSVLGPVLFLINTSVSSYMLMTLKFTWRLLMILIALHYKLLLIK